MATITGLSGNTTYSLNVGSNDQNGTAQTLASAISAALANGSLGQQGQSAPAGTPSFTILSTPGSYALSSAQNATAIGTGGASTVFGSGALNEQIIGDNGATTLALRGGSGSVVLGDGNDFVTAAAVGTTGFNIRTGTGNDTILGLGGNNSINAGAGRNLIGLGNGQNTVSLNGNDTLYGNGSGGGSETVFGGSGPALVFPLSSNLYFIGGTGPSTVIGGTGSATVFAGTGGSTIGGGSAGFNKLVNAQGGSATLFGAAQGDLLYATGRGFTIMVAGSGNETLDGSTSTANNVFYGSNGPTASTAASITGGSGADTIYAGTNSVIRGGAGADQIIFQAGRTSGTVQVLGFNPAEKASFQGYAGSNFTTGIVGSGVGTAAGASVGQTVQVGGVNSTQIALGNGTTIQFVGVTGLTGSSFN